MRPEPPERHATFNDDQGHRSGEHSDAAVFWLESLQEMAGGAGGVEAMPLSHRAISHRPGRRPAFWQAWAARLAAATSSLSLVTVAGSRKRG
jgi:hypothetical protein